VVVVVVIINLVWRRLTLFSMTLFSMKDHNLGLYPIGVIEVNQHYNYGDSIRSCPLSLNRLILPTLTVL
jgi:hypothetical protein